MRHESLGAAWRVLVALAKALKTILGVRKIGGVASVGLLGKCSRGGWLYAEILGEAWSCNTKQPLKTREVCEVFMSFLCRKWERRAIRHKKSASSRLPVAALLGADGGFAGAVIENHPHVRQRFGKGSPPAEEDQRRIGQSSVDP